jgi:lactoylglutathione lyase
MKIEHIAIWVDDLEKMRSFYTTYFDCATGEKYHNPRKSFYSYFVEFNKGGCRLELMSRPDIPEGESRRGFAKGICHFAISVGGKEKVDELTERLRKDNFSIESEPRTTGDGYYESVVLDPEGNYVEISE